MIKKVAIVHTDFRLYWPIRLQHLGKYLSEKGIVLDVVEASSKGSPYFFDQSSLKPKEVKWTCLYDDTKMEDVSAHEVVKKVILTLDTIKPDVVIAGPIAFPTGAAAVRWCCLRRIPLICFDDVRLQDVPRPRYVNWVKKQVYSLVDAMMIPAPSHDNTYVSFGFSKEQLFYGINCVDNDYFASHDQDNVEGINLYQYQPYFLVVGRQIAVKNNVSLLSAFKNVSSDSKLKNWNLIFVGDGPEHCRLVDAAGELNGKRIFFFGYKKQNVIKKFYNHSQCLVLPSISETWGLVVNEGMAAGLPIIVSKYCGCTEILVKDGFNGIVFDPVDRKNIENSLLRFAQLTDSEKMRMGEASIKIVNSWGLNRFCEGVWCSIRFVLSAQKKRGSIFSRIISKYWNGRYNPR